MKNVAILFALGGIGMLLTGDAQAQVVAGYPPVVVAPAVVYPVRPFVGGRRATYYAPIPVASSATYAVVPTVSPVLPTVNAAPAYQTTPRFQSQATPADFAPTITNYPSAATFGTTNPGAPVTTYHAPPTVSNYAPQTVTTYRVDALAPTTPARPTMQPFPRTVTYPPAYATPNIRGYGN